MTEIVRVGASAAGAQSIVVPADATFLTGFSVIGRYRDGLGNEQPVQAWITADNSGDVAANIDGSATRIMAVANQFFRKIPVSPSERLLVTFEDHGSAVIYFETP